MFRVVAPMLLKPLPIAIALLAMAIWRRRRWPVLAATGLIWIASTPLTAGLLIRWVERGYRQPAVNRVPEADFILVLSGSDCRELPDRPDVIEFNDASRLMGGLDLLRAGRAPRIIFTRGPVGSTRSDVDEGEVLRQRAEQAGVDPDAIVLVGPAATTMEEARATREFLSPQDGSVVRRTMHRAANVILVTSARHMARAEMAFKAVGLEVIPFPVDFRSGRTWTVRAVLPSAKALAETDAALHEVYGRFVQWIQNLWSEPSGSSEDPSDATLPS